MELLFFVVGCIIVAFGITAFTGAPYIPTRKREIVEMFDSLRPLRSEDVVLDLGSGDGIVLREVSRRGARAIGYELSVILVWISKLLSRGDSRVRVELANFFSRPFPDDVTIVYIFGDGRDIKKMTRRIETEAKRLARPIDVVSYGFRLDGHDAVKTHRAHALYTVAPSVALHSVEA